MDYWLLVLGGVTVPYLWLIVRVASIAYFQSKMDYHKMVLNNLEKENCSD